MPFAICPRCGRLSHMSIATTNEEWFRQHFPDADPKEPAPALCYFCWKELGMPDLDEMQRIERQHGDGN